MTHDGEVEIFGLLIGIPLLIAFVMLVVTAIVLMVAGLVTGFFSVGAVFGGGVALRNYFQALFANMSLEPATA